MNIIISDRLVLQRQPPIACTSITATLSDETILSAQLIDSVTIPVRLPPEQVTLQGRYERCTKETL